MAMTLEAKIDRLFENPLTALDLKVLAAMGVLGVGAAMVLRVRGDVFALRVVGTSGAAAFLGAWLTHHARLATFLEISTGPWEWAVPTLLGGIAGATMAEHQKWLRSAVLWGLTWGTLVRIAALLALFSRRA